MQGKISKSDLNFIKNWHASRKMGIMKFAALNGIIYGILLFAFTGLFDINKSSFQKVYFSQQSMLIFLIWLFFGIFGYGFMMWWLNQYLFKKRLKKYNLEEEDLTELLKNNL